MPQPTPAGNSAMASGPRQGMVSHPLCQLLAGLIAGAAAWAFITSASFPRVDPAGIAPPVVGQPQDDGGAGAGGPPNRDDASARGSALPPEDVANSESAAAAVGEDSSTGSSPASDGEVTTDSIGSDEVIGADGCQPPEDETSSPASEAAPETDVEQPTVTELAGDDPSVDSGEQSTPQAATEPAADDPQLIESGEAMMREAMSNMGGGGMMGPPPPLTPEQLEARRIASIKNAGIKIGFFGALLCGLFGLVEGISRRSLIAPLAGLLVGLFLGAAGGGLAGLSGMSLYHVKFDDLAPEYLDRHPKIDELRPILEGMVTYATMWGIVGVAAGLSMSLLSRRPKTMLRSVTGAVIGGVLGGVLYATLEAWAFPLATEGLVVPRGTQNGLLWALLPAGLIGLLGSWQGRVQPKAKGEGKRGKAVRPAAAH